MCVFSGKTPANNKENDKNTVISNKESGKSADNIKKSFCFPQHEYINGRANSSCRTFHNADKTNFGEKYFYKNIDKEVCENYFEYLSKDKIKRKRHKKASSEIQNKNWHTELFQSHNIFVKNQKFDTPQNIRFHSSQANCDHKNYLTKILQRDTIETSRLERYKKNFPVSNLKSHFRTLLVIFITILYVATIINGAAATESKIYTNEWVIEVEGGEKEARNIARQHNLVYVDKVMDNFYLVKSRRVMKRSLRSRIQVNKELLKDHHIRWVEQQVAKKRVKRLAFNDPKWARMWYMNQASEYSMDIHKSWDRGYTGRGIVVSILDDGIEKDHPDLKNNYDARASYDVNDHDRDPQPRYEPTNENKHGTRCAGEVAAEANNNICGVGVAFNAGIGGIRMLDGDVTDAVEARSLSWEPQHISIYSASWGPDDDGRTVDGPGPMAWRAFEEGVTKGRRGLGSIYVWASGNGGQYSDNCNCDGYTNLIYTLSISSASEQGRIPWYAEPCSSALATTYSSGAQGEKAIVTTDLNKDCTENHTGTSASAPLAAGICALVLEANPMLTWRDLQHIVVMSAKPANLIAHDWTLNGAGRNVSHSFGFGIMDVNKMIDLAENWTMVPPQSKCIQSSFIPNKGLSVNSRFVTHLNSDGCSDTQDEIRYLEHVQIVVTIATSRRGELEVNLISPRGTKSNMLTRRSRDMSSEGFNNWTFMTTHCWGEDPAGKWELEVKNYASSYSHARLHRWTLVLHGTSTKPYPYHQWNSHPPSTSLFSHKYSHPHHPRYANGQYHPMTYPESPLPNLQIRKQNNNKPLRSHQFKSHNYQQPQNPYKSYFLKSHPYHFSASSSSNSFWSFSSSSSTLPYTIVRIIILHFILFIFNIKLY